MRTRCGPIVSAAAATAASDNAKARLAARAKCGRVTVWGRPAVRPGDGIELKDLPGSTANGLLAAAAGLLGGGDAAPSWRATQVRHVFGFDRGLVSLLELEGGAAAGGGGLLGGLL